MTWCLNCILSTLLLLAAANGGPVLARKLLKKRHANPVDGGLTLPDAHPLFGRSKTWRGFAAGILAGALTAWPLGFTPLTGAGFALLALLGDLFTSFCKRRLGKVESSRARGFDTVPESWLPAWAYANQLGLGNQDIALVVLLFFLLEEFVSPLLYKWHIRLRPY